MPDRSDRLSKEDAYWIGFLLGDGSVTQHPNGTYRLKVTLSNKDRSHIETFSNWFGGNYIIRDTQKGCVSISVYNQDRIEWVMDYGVVPRKTEIVELPDVPNIQSLIRGYSDADGYIGAPGGSGFRWSIASNSETVLEDIKNKVPISGGRIVTNETAGTNYLTYGKLKMADGVADYLYPNGYNTSPSLYRKKDTALKRAAWALQKTRNIEPSSYAR